jgi:thioredoxin reductase (NADPH)
VTGEAIHDLIVVGAGPTGIAIGARARQRALDVLLIDRGPLAASLVGFPTYMSFFTTRDLLEIADVPFAISHEKPTRREALSYYRAVAQLYELPLALFENVESVQATGGRFEVTSVAGKRRVSRRSRFIALATGYFHRPRQLGVLGEEQAWVRHRYLEPYGHFRQHVAVIGGGNSAAETALDLWRNHVRVTVIHRRSEVKKTVKYWVKPDFENRVDEGSIATRLDSTVERFGDHRLILATPEGPEELEVDAAYVLVGYEPDAGMMRDCGIEIDDKTLEPSFDADSCESNVPGLYVAGTLQAGRDLGRIFIENSREHADRIVEHVAGRLGKKSNRRA